MPAISVYALFHTCGELENSIVRLRTAGFRDADISVLYPHNDVRREAHDRSKICTPAVLGGALGWLASAAVVALPGAGLFIAAGPVMSVLVNGSMGSSAGIVTASLAALGIPREDAGRFAGRIARGALLIVVHCDDATWSANAEGILKESGAENISEFTAAGHAQSAELEAAL